MEQFDSADIPTHPKLRPVDPHWIDYQGQQYLLLRDTMGLTEQTMLVPQALAPLLALCDGTRDFTMLQSSLMLRTGLQLPLSTIEGFFGQLDAALLLENGAYQRASELALKEYRDTRQRRPSHAGLVYPANAADLASTFQEYCQRVEVEDDPAASSANLVGMVCPHIDYMRGHETYAELWQRAAPSLDDVELAIIFGTDHSGGSGMLTLTRQDYVTPLGALPTDRDIVNGLADVIGPQRAFAEEIHHIKEHSIELASVWFHYFIGGRPCPIVPILCGSFYDFIIGKESPSEDDGISAALEYLKQATSGRKTLVIAAGDLAHVGPAFGDPLPMDTIARAKLTAQDSESLTAICDGDSEAFFQLSQTESDIRRLCGLPPIYLTLRYLEGARGESLGYAQCPADADGGSLVSIAGVLLYEPS
ncbi:MAG: AmmeMemoRadiSam system protein B [Chloroflexi bacterium]|nr:AmmeMemoRadiSam system protein B [Chloroflexota bacterium]